MSIVPSQILYLEHGSSRLYAEAIQVVSNRQLCWARPTLLIQKLPENVSRATRQAAITNAAQSFETSQLKIYDLEGCPDLIWPLAPFNIAYDLDFFSLLIQLKITPDESTQPKGSSQLNEFIRSFWRSHADIFNFKPASELSS
ncbi:MAG: hypothetical protein AAF528_06380 [Cyanobacteria bacterium P01_C01_bin.121]